MKFVHFRHSLRYYVRHQVDVFRRNDTEKFHRTLIALDNPCHREMRNPQDTVHGVDRCEECHSRRQISQQYMIQNFFLANYINIHSSSRSFCTESDSQTVVQETYFC